MAALRHLAGQKNTAFRQSFIGRELSAVTLKSDTPGITPALSDNFLKIAVETEYPANRTIQVKVTQLTENGLQADILSW
jgi:hypothetical protein